MGWYSREGHHEQHLDHHLSVGYRKYWCYGGRKHKKNYRKEFSNLTERFLLPHGLCKVYVGKPMYNMWFTVEDDEEANEYVLYIADASASNAFTVC